MKQIRFKKMQEFVLSPRTILVSAVLFALGGFLSILLTRHLHDSDVVVGLDLAKAPTAPPVLIGTDHLGERSVQIPMRLMPDRYSRVRDYFFELTATGEKNPQAKGAEVWLLNEASFKGLVQQPPNSWKRKEKDLVTTGSKRAKVSWRGLAKAPAIELGRHEWSGIATYKTAAGEQRLDLYYRNEPEIKVPLKELALAPGTVWFEVTATGGRNPESKGNEVWLIDFPEKEKLIQDPPGSWQTKGKDLVHTGDKPATLRFKGELKTPRIVLGKHGWSGLAEVITAEGKQSYDLYATGGTIPINLPQEAATAGGDFSFELMATATRNPAAKGNEVWLLNFPDKDHLVQDPPGSWQVKGNDIFCTGDKPAVLRWRGSLAQPQIVLGNHEWSGIAKVKTAAGEQTCDLYGKGGSTKIALAKMGQTTQEPIYQFELTALGDKNPLSQGTRVRLKGFTHPEQCTQTPPGSWTREGGDWVCAGQQASTLSWQGPLTPGTHTLTLAKDPASGRARLKTADGEQVLDLFNAKNPAVRLNVPPATFCARYYARVPRHLLGNLALRIPGTAAPRIDRLFIGTLEPTVFFGGPAPEDVWGRVVPNWKPTVNGGLIQILPSGVLESGGTITFIFFTLAIGVALLTLGALMAWGVHRVRTRPAADFPERRLPAFLWAHFLIFFIPLAGYWLFVLACFSAGGLSAQAHDLFEKACSLNVRDGQSAMWVVTVWALGRLWEHPGVVAVAQILLLAAALASAFTLLLRAGVPFLWLMGGYLVSLLSPRNTVMAITMNPQALYAALLLFVGVLLAQAVLDRRGARARILWRMLGLILALLPLFRADGWPITVVILALLAPLFRPYRQRALQAVAVCLVAIFMLKFGLFQALGVAAGSSPAKRHFIATAGSMARQDLPLDERQYQILEEVGLVNENWACALTQAQGEKIGAAGDSSPAPTIRHPYAELGAGLLRDYPWISLHARLRDAEALAVQGRSEEAVGSADPLDGLKDTFAPAQARGLGRAAAALRGFLEWTTQQNRLFLLWLPTIPLAAVLLALLALLYRTRERRFILVYLPFLFYAIALLVNAPEECLGCQFPLTFASTFLVGLAMLTIGPRKAQTSGGQFLNYNKERSGSKTEDGTTAKG